MTANRPDDGYLALVLHAHLPYVRHPEHPVFLEERWLFEAMLECYLPLLDRLTTLQQQGVPFRLTMSISPTLCEMFTDDLLQQRFCRHMEQLIELAEQEQLRNAADPQLQSLSEMYLRNFRRIYHIYQHTFDRDLISAFRSLQDQGVLEIACCAATHAFLPLISHPRCLRAQIRMGKASYRHHFRHDPEGIWLPECAYQPGIDQELFAEGLRYFFLDSHGLLFGTPRPRYGTFAPVYCRSRIAAFARDIESSKQVWSANMGYPGDPAYREFYRDLGYDAEEEYIRSYLQVPTDRHDVGIKYYRVTGDVPLADKALYHASAARQKACIHARDFLENRQKQARHYHRLLQQKPLVVAPYDAELFGHWWYEGPDFLTALLRESASQNIIRLTTPGDYLVQHPNQQVIEPSPSSWGDKGYYEVWLNGKNDWLYRHLHTAEERMCALVDQHPDTNGLTRRALNQAARELMLAQSSDWAFIMTTGTMEQYAISRFERHIERFNTLHTMITKNAVNEDQLRPMEEQDNLFANLDYRIYAS